MTCSMLRRHDTRRFGNFRRPCLNVDAQLQKHCATILCPCLGFGLLQQKLFSLSLSKLRRWDAGPEATQGRRVSAKGQGCGQQLWCIGRRRVGPRLEGLVDLRKWRQVWRGHTELQGAAPKPLLQLSWQAVVSKSEQGWQREAPQPAGAAVCGKLWLEHTS